MTATQKQKMIPLDHRKQKVILNSLFHCTALHCTCTALAENGGKGIAHIISQSEILGKYHVLTCFNILHVTSYENCKTRLGHTKNNLSAGFRCFSFLDFDFFFFKSEAVVLW